MPRGRSRSRSRDGPGPQSRNRHVGVKNSGHPHAILHVKALESL